MGWIKEKIFIRNGKGKFEIPEIGYKYDGDWIMNKRSGIAAVTDKSHTFKG
jgi:hypothetical protein